MRIGSDIAASPVVAEYQLVSYGSQEKAGGGTLRFINSRYGSTCALIKGTRQTVEDGLLDFYTQATGGTLTKRLTIDKDGLADFTGAVNVQGALTSLGIDDDATKEVFDLLSTDVQAKWGNAAETSFTHSMRDADQLMVVSGGDDSGNGANIFLYGGSHATAAGDFAIRDTTSAVIAYDNSASTITLSPTAGTTSVVLTTSNMTVGNGADYGIQHSVNTNALALTGSTNANFGANIWFYGEGHATTANDFRIRSDTNNVIYYDDSGATITLYPSKGAASQIFKNNITQLGPNTNANHVLARQATSGSLQIGGGSSGSTGSYLALYGNAHATLASDFQLGQGATPVIYYDHSATTLTLSPTTVVSTLAGVGTRNVAADDAGTLIIATVASSDIVLDPSDITAINNAADLAALKAALIAALGP
jgi:hypothetical protein